MPSDISRKLFNRKKHYSGVIHQQGRVSLDADLNEQLDIQQYRTHTQTKDVIGVSGVPKKKKNGFKIEPSADGTSLVISPGRIYVRGLLCELEKPANPADPATYHNQPYYPDPDLTAFNIFSPPASPAGSPPSAPELEIADGTYIVYIDAWQREINFLNDALIQEVALGEADTTTRLKTIWQVKLMDLGEVNPAAVSCKTPAAKWEELVNRVKGKLRARTNKNTTVNNPCSMKPGSGFRGLENQLYRVEIHRGGPRGNATFKWSRNNAVFETKIESVVSATAIKVTTTGMDDVMNFTNGQWVEIIDEVSALHNEPHPLVKIVEVDPATRTITLDTSVAIRPNSKLRSWDHAGLIGTSDGMPLIPTPDTGWVALEDGIEVNFSGAAEDMYKSGDYWLIPARTATAEIEWPPFLPGADPDAQPPVGIIHYYSRLAIVKASNGHVVIEDCRKIFPSLTEICAEDICVKSPEGCDSFAGAKNVQEALDMLCKSRQGACTFLAVPGPGWESVFNRVGVGQDAQICFQVGDYPLENAVTITGKGNLKLTGCGAGTRILATKTEAALIFNNCNSVNIRDIYVETGLASSGKDTPKQHLNGTLTFTNCLLVDVEHVSLKCGEGTKRSASCININNANLSANGFVRVQDCNMKVGHRQQGILLVNVVYGLIENNVIGVYQKGSKLRSLNILQVRQNRAELKKSLMYKVQLGATSPSNPGANVVLRSGAHSINFTSDNKLKNIWQTLWSENAPVQATSNKALLKHVKKLTDRLLTDEAFRKRYPGFRDIIGVLNTPERAVASQGITVGGQRAGDIRILNNFIEGFLQGIHVGLSHKPTIQTGLFRDLAAVVTIAGNTIGIVLPADAIKLERHGIFAGNFISLIIENNNILLERLAGAERMLIFGIKVWGEFGDRLMITHNVIGRSATVERFGFSIGIVAQPINAKPTFALWVITWNVIPSTIQQPILKPASVIAPPGTNSV